MTSFFLVPTAFSTKKITHLLAFGFGSGLFKKAPGTFGTVAGLLFYVLFLSHSVLVLFMSTVLGFVLGVWICSRVSDDLGVSDFGGIVWDEFVGLWVTLCFLPFMGVDALQGVYLLLAFVLFRLFDILKPWPIVVLDKQVHGGFGIMIDDVVAGLYAGVCLWLCDRYVLDFFPVLVG